jgi:hypothetical protein
MDLIQRLRKQAVIAGPSALFGGKLCLEAAAEIERLQTEVVSWKKVADDMGKYSDARRKRIQQIIERCLEQIQQL